MSSSESSPFVTKRRSASRCHFGRSDDHVRISWRTFTGIPFYAANKPAPNRSKRLDVELQWLFVRVARRTHRQHVAHLVRKANRERKSVVVIASVIVDLGKAHDVGKHGANVRASSRATQNCNRQWIWRFRTDIGIQSWHKAVRPQQRVSVVEDDGSSAHHWIIAVAK